MPFVPVTNTVLAELRYDYLNQQVENTLWFLGDDAPDVSSMTALGVALVDWWSSGIQQLQNVAVALREVVITDMTSDTGPQVTHVGPLPLNGEVAEEPLPMNDTLAISFRTGNRGRSFRGRNYFVGMSRTQYVGNEATGAFINAYTTAYEGLLGGAATPAWTWVVASRFSGIDGVTGKPIPRVSGIATPILTVTVADSIMDSQRRRLPGRGN